MKSIFLFPSLFFSLLALFGQNQKLNITPKAYSKWKTITAPQISERGNLISYLISPQVGDDELIIDNRLKNKTLSIERGEKVFISPDEQWLSFSIVNYHDSIRSLKLKNISKKKWPLDSLCFYNVLKDSLVKFNSVESYKQGELGGNWTAMLRSEDYKLKESTVKKKRKWFFKKKKKKAIKENNGAILTLYNPLTFTTKNIISVKDYEMSKNGKSIYYSTSYKYNDTIDSCFLYRWDTKNGLTKLIKKDEGFYNQLTTSKSGDQFSFLYSSDTTKEKQYQLYYWSSSLDSSKLIVDTLSAQFDSTKSVSEFHRSYFSDNGNYLFFKVGEKPVVKKKDTLTDDEKYSLDLWSWTDSRLQTQQLKNLEKDKKKADLYVFSTATNSIKKLASSNEVIMDRDPTNNKNFILFRSQTPYLKEMTWDGWYYDYYLVDIKTGSRQLLLKKHNDVIKVSESGKKIAFYARKDSAWFCKDISINKTTQLTHLKRFHNQHHDVPGLPSSAGSVIWAENGSYVVIKGQYDYWKIAIDGSENKLLTSGRENSTIYNYWRTNDKNTKTLNLDSAIFFKTYNEVNKKEGVSILKNKKLTQLFLHDKKIVLLKKAKRSEHLILREMSFISYPDLQLTNLDFTSFDRLSNINPQQKDYNWGKVELVSWESYHNKDSLSGLLYKPENFDSTKSYPMIIYFYERNSQNYHRYYSPKPTASIVYPTEYVSNEYIVFIPDIKYEIGKPAQGAYDCIVSGTDFLTRKHTYIDSTRLGLQGQSWGGYQTAQLITMTNKYKCAMAGAPVSNMFSAYGGIRWGSGLNRAFQYEKGQSRIGKTIWEAPELYIENSPLFHLQNVTTPLLIMHNDGDGAVPWSQGLELFNGLRRLNKPVWLLNYNKDAHNLKKRANKLDLSIRMKQFFDFYLQETTAPDWLKKGRPAIIKELENSN